MSLLLITLKPLNVTLLLPGRPERYYQEYYWLTIIIIA